MPPPSNVPDDPFKKPYLPQQRTSEPQQQYIHNGQLLLPSFLSSPQICVCCCFRRVARATDVVLHSSAQSPPFNPRYSQQPPASSASSISNTSTTSRETIQPTTTSLSYTPVSSMTASAVPVTSSAPLTSPPESPSQAQDPSSQTSKSSALDQERIDALLTVNNLLLQEVQILQKAGLKATAQSPQQANPANASSPQTKPEAATPTSTDPAEAAGQNAPTPSSVTTPTTTTPTTLVPPQPSNNPTQNQKKFVEYMGRLKANIYYLVAISNQEKTKQTPKPQYPALLELPPAWLAEALKDDDYKRFEALKEGYVKLRELWPDWKPPQRPTPQQLAQQQQQQQLAQQQASQQSASQQQTQQQPAQQQAQQQQAQQQHPQLPLAQQQQVQ